MWWVGCHGGAGVTTMRQLTGLGMEARTWPVPPPGWPTSVVLVCRASASGTAAACGWIEQVVERRLPSGVRVVGLVAVAASRRRPARLVVERLKLMRSWLPAVWRVGWVEALLATTELGDVGPSPDVLAVREAVGRSVIEAVETAKKEGRDGS